MTRSPLILLLLSAAVGAAAAVPRYREAPHFTNSAAAQCPPPLHPSDADAACSPHAAVHVAMTLDASYLRGTMAAVLSVLRHASCPESIHFHFIASAAGSSKATAEELRATVRASFPSLAFRVYPFADEARVAGLITTSIRGALDRPLNYARSYLASTLPPCVRRVVYLDSDVVLTDDIAALAATPLPGTETAVAAPQYCGANFTAYFTPGFWASPRCPPPSRAAAPATSTRASWCWTSRGGAARATRRRSRSGWSCRSGCASTSWARCRRSCSCSRGGSRPWTTAGTSTASAGTTTGASAAACTPAPSACCTGAARGSPGTA
ncbi:unnamed protein product [Miscanthus lutarioriparius]|uniref:Hexosyltransferase n=1 Tax=Miscanthus lutarioriparius TaxID=422564 RepID=A0A811N1G8_9POAL|nr:unnamed protein product [Miscanthus lutarioriparius]